MVTFPHKDKLIAALANPKVQVNRNDMALLREALSAYNIWINRMTTATTEGNALIEELISYLNEYKDYLEVELIAKSGSNFLKRQKGQLKLDNSVMEEFLPYLIDTRIIENLPTNFLLESGSYTSFMSLSFCPTDVNSLGNRPSVIIKDKDQDFAIGKSLYYKFSSDSNFEDSKTINGSTFLAVLATECKVNYDKTMFQECAGTAERLKQGCPISKYYTLVEYLDMTPEDTRLTSIDNVFLIRKAHRLPPDKRNSYEEVKQQHRDYPINLEVMKKFVSEIQKFINATWYNPDEALNRGSFV